MKPQAGWFQAYYPGADGKRVHHLERFATAEDAREWLDDLARERNHGSWHDPAAGAQRLDQYATTWLAAHDCSPSTRELYAGYLDNHILPGLGLLQLRQISPPVVRQWYAKEGEKGTQTARARSYALLHQILAVAVDDGAITANPCRIKDVAKTIRHRTKATPDLVQFRRIVARMPKKYRMLLLLAVGSTARYGELVALRRRDVDLAAGSLRFESQWYRGQFKPTKRAASDQVVYLPPMLVELLRVHMALFVGPNPDALLTASRNGSPPPTNWINQQIREASAPLGRDDFTFHSLRHLGGTLTAQTGASTREGMRRMGQATARAFLIYQRAFDERDQAIAARIGLGAASGGGVLPLPSEDELAERRRRRDGTG
ncbi:tyrosine-type recombinase/integrase [Cellulomonas soli]|uniref:Putative prophage phiRv2 integrase n=1 Tax=Cellulomonas soli TaxID=931535 RepID=A0A512PB43_9CELL|nr:site-specific integrase [Cellulomonas soli]NYI57290.1 integrase [Cellulomonas soli]GEP68430.1 putative prophage phiRv2 integrase [Cellulomonas soli]